MKFCCLIEKERLPISEDEIPKIVKAMQSKNIIVLKSGVLNGAYIRGIVRDIHGERGLNYGYQIQGNDKVGRKDFATDLPEKFRNIKEILRLGSNI